MKIGSRSGILTSLSLLALFNVSPGRAQQTKAPFTSGETLTYEVTWKVFSAGQVVATLRKTGETARDDYEVKATARSQGFVSLLFKVRNEFDALFDPQTLCSHQISKQVHEGRRHKETHIVFDAARRLAILDERDLGNPNAPPKHAENEIPACVADVVSAFYFVRSRPLQVGEKFALNINDGSKTHEVLVDVQARERIETPLGSRIALRVEPKVFGGLYRRKGRMLLWFSDDEQRLPLRVKAMISLGAITGTLKSVSTDPASDASGKP